MPYKHTFFRQYPVTALDNQSPAKAFTLQGDGQLLVSLSDRQEMIPVMDCPKACSGSKVVLDQGKSYQAMTPDNRFAARIVAERRAEGVEFWLQHIDQATGRSQRVKLSADSRVRPSYVPRVAVSPKGYFFIADDAGTVRLYTARHLIAVGVFQVAHASKDNRLISLAISADETCLAGLSSWKDIVLYNVPQRRLLLVRQIQDLSGWYDQGPGLIALLGEGEAVVTVGIGQAQGAPAGSPPVISANGFRFVLLPGKST